MTILKDRGDMSIGSFFNVVFDVAIILALITFSLGFLYLYASREDTER